MTLEGSDPGTIEGYASVFHTLDAHHDRILKGAFKNTLLEWKKTNKMPKMLWQHKHDKPIGRWISINEDDVGLYVKGQLLLDLPKAYQAYTLIKAGILENFSIGFIPEKVIDRPKIRERWIYHVKLLEISLVTFPANADARISAYKHHVFI